MNGLNKYRGKAFPDGTWVVGFLEAEDRIVTEYQNGSVKERRIFLVDRNTVGLCSGKQDENEKDIFQGDVIENEYGIKFEVRFGKYAMYCPVDNCMMENVGFYAVADGYYEDMPLGPTEEYAAIIGNIHDNPDLKVGERYRCPGELKAVKKTEDKEESEKKYN